MSVYIPDYARLATREVAVGPLLLGGGHPIRIQTMTTTDTMDTAATMAQTIRCIKAGAELVRITAPSKKEAENLAEIKKQVRAAGYDTPLVADIHFTPNAAEIAARIVEKVRINPGNYVDKKKFDQIDYTDAGYAAEIDRIRERFTPLVSICKAHGTAMRIGTNHGSLSDRIMSRYGDTAHGMVESAMEFLRIARDENYHQIILSMKSSNPIVMVEAYRLLVRHMQEEFGECYPLHLGVTEAGDGEDGRIKSAIGIGTLLQEGIGDTIRVSLTEEPEFELPVCRDLVEKVESMPAVSGKEKAAKSLPRAGFGTLKKPAGGHGIMKVRYPVVADYRQAAAIPPEDLAAIGYTYDSAPDKWHIADGAADFIYTGEKLLDFPLPGTLQAVLEGKVWTTLTNRNGYIPHWPLAEYDKTLLHPELNIISADVTESLLNNTEQMAVMEHLAGHPSVLLCLYSTTNTPAAAIRTLAQSLAGKGLKPCFIIGDISFADTVDKQLIDFSMTSGALLLDDIGHGLWLMNDPQKLKTSRSTGRTYLPVKNNHQFLNNTAFSILQATRKRISKTEYISCPSCGRTLFDLQETTAKIRNATNHLKGVKIAIMGCIVNGPGEMADADFGYVGSGTGKITLYKSKEVMKRNVPSEIAVDELISLMKEHGAWVEAIS